MNGKIVLDYLIEESRKMKQGDISPIQSDLRRKEREQEVAEDLDFCIEYLQKDLAALDVFKSMIKKLHDFKTKFAIEFNDESLYFILYLFMLSQKALKIKLSSSL